MRLTTDRCLLYVVVIIEVIIIILMVFFKWIFPKLPVFIGDESSVAPEPDPEPDESAEPAI